MLQSRFNTATINLKDLSYGNYLKTTGHFLLLSIFVVLATIGNIFWMCFVPGAITSIESIGMIAPIQMIFMHLCLLSILNISVYLHASAKIENNTTIYNIIANLFITTFIYGIIISLVFFGATYGYLSRLFMYNVSMQHSAMVYLNMVAAVPFLYAVITLSIKIIKFLDHPQTVAYLFIFAVVVNIALPPILCFSAGMEIQGLGLGMLLGFLITAMITFSFAFFYLDLEKHQFHFLPKLSFKLLKETWRITSIFILVSVGKCIALVTMAIASKNKAQTTDNIIAQVVVYNLLNLVAAIPRGTGQSLTYRYYDQKIEPKEFLKYKNNIHKICIWSVLSTICFGIIIIGMFPLYVDLILGHNPDVILEGSVTHLKISMITPCILILFFDIGILATLVYTPFLNGVTGKQTTYWYIVSGLSIMVILIFTLGFTYINSLPSVTTLMIPMAAYGIYIAFCTPFIWHHYLKKIKTMEESNNCRIVN